MEKTARKRYVIYKCFYLAAAAFGLPHICNSLCFAFLFPFRINYSLGRKLFEAWMTSILLTQGCHMYFGGPLQFNVQRILHGFRLLFSLLYGWDRWLVSCTHPHPFKDHQRHLRIYRLPKDKKHHNAIYILLHFSLNIIIFRSMEGKPTTTTLSLMDVLLNLRL